jgi:ribosomal-protein-alanine N-acetyltransferase
MNVTDKVTNCELSQLPLSILEKVMQLDQKVMEYPWKDKEWRQAWNSEQSFKFLYIMDDQQNLLAFTLFSTPQGDDTMHLLKIVVNSKLQRKGYASSMLRRSLSLSKPIYLEVDENNLGAIAFYQKFNFRELHRQKAFYSNGNGAIKMISH